MGLSDYVILVQLGRKHLASVSYAPHGCSICDNSLAIVMCHTVG